MNIFRSNGHYLGFVKRDFLFSRDGAYLAWIDDDNNVWDTRGKYRGRLEEINKQKYILKNKYAMSPVPIPSKPTPPAPSIPAPPPNIPSIVLSIDLEDGF